MLINDRHVLSHVLPPCKGLHNYGKIHYVQWVNQSSMAYVSLPEGRCGTIGDGTKMLSGSRICYSLKWIIQTQKKWPLDAIMDKSMMNPWILGTRKTTRVSDRDPRGTSVGVRLLAASCGGP